MIPRAALALLLALPGLLSAQTPAASPTPAFETPPTLETTVILRPEFTQGPNFSLFPQARPLGGQNRYIISSDFGTFHATGNTQLVIRLREIAAIAQLRALSKTERYKEALKAAAKSPLELAGNLVAHPVDTVSGVPKGVWKMLNRAGQTAKEIASQRPTSDYEDNALKDLIGLSEVKRKLAAELGVDPYSTNEVLQHELDSVAWASYAGKMTFAGALMPIGGAAGLAITGVNASGSALQALRDLSPNDLRRENLKKLLGMGVSREDANRFLNNPALSPTHQTLIVDAMERIHQTLGRETFIRLAADSTDESDANSYLRSAQLLAHIHDRQPLALLSAHQGIPLALAKDGTLIAPIEWDHASWTPGAAQFVTAFKNGTIPDQKITGRHIYLTGTASPRARDEVAAQGIALTEKALPGPLR